jgi:acyl-coenzyme A thioesterase PaaI-like protein
MRAPKNSLLKRWERLASMPGGRWLFSFLLGCMVPYSGSIRPRVLELKAGHARVAMADRRAVRNHLRSIHAIALINLAEVTSGLAMLSGLDPAARGIVTSISMEYLKKARGRLLGSSQCTPPVGCEERELEISVALTDASGETVARALVSWKIGSVAASPSP